MTDEPSSSPENPGQKFFLSGGEGSVPSVLSIRTSMAANVTPTSMPEGNVVTVVRTRAKGDNVAHHVMNSPVEAT